MVRFSLVAVVAVVTARSALAGPCAVPSYHPEPINLGKPLAPDGGVLVSLDIGLGGNGLGGGTLGDQIVQPSWRFKVGGQLVAPASVKEIAPGLAVYQLPASGASLTLVDGKRDLITVTRGADQPKLAAPTVKAIEHVVVRSNMGPRSWESRTVNAQLAVAPPAGAFAMIVYVDGKAVSWGRTDDPTTKTIPVYTSPGRCSLQIPNQVEPTIGASVTVAWVDTNGRVSPQSKPLVVRAGTAPRNPNQPQP